MPPKLPPHQIIPPLWQHPHFPEDGERRTPSPRTLSDADIEAIASAFNRTCNFSEQERVALESLAKIDPNVLSLLAGAYTNATNAMWKGLVALALIGALFLALVGAGVKIPGKW